MKFGMLAALALAAPSAFAQDVTSLPAQCSSGAAQAKTIKEVQMMYDPTMGPNGGGWDAQKHACYPTKKEFLGTKVSTSGVVTAKGAHKDSYNPNYFWIQMPSSDFVPEKFTGIEVFYEAHVNSIEIGDMVEIEGIVAEEPVGLTILKLCKPPVVKSSNNELPRPIEVSTELFHNNACSVEVEGLEGMLITLKNVETVPCKNAITERMGKYDQCEGGFALTDTPSWDKYKQMWIKTQGSEHIVELDNHILSAFVHFQSKPGTKWESVTGIVSYYSSSCHIYDPDLQQEQKGCTAKDSWGDAAWDIIPRSTSDFKAPSMEPLLNAAKAMSIKDVQQIDNMYGNDVGGVPTILLGTDIKNSKGETGTGHWPLTGSAGGSCPSSHGQSWYYDKSLNPNRQYGSKVHGLCSCFPPNFASELGPGTLNSEVVKVKGTVSYTMGDTKAFYMEDTSRCGQSQNGLFVYRSGPEKLAPGDEVEVFAKLKSYYGGDQLSDVFKITKLASGKSNCPVMPGNAADFHIDASSPVNFCRKSAEQYEYQLMEFRNMKVVGFTEDAVEVNSAGKNIMTDVIEMTSPSGAKSKIEAYYGPYENHRCKRGDGKPVGCQFIAEDESGKQVLIDNKLKGIEAYFQDGGVNPGSKVLKIGDTFQAIHCYIEQHRGDYPRGNGGHYECNPPSKDHLKGRNQGFIKGGAQVGAGPGGSPVGGETANTKTSGAGVLGAMIPAMMAAIVQLLFFFTA
ncbi:hypothetical protein RI054_17g81450 [Pseudoscourfieldia marina]